MVPLWSAALVIGLVAVATLMERQYKHLSQLGGFFPVAGILAIAACIAENSCISWYRYYQYSNDWGIFLGHVPLHVVLIWPLFILGEHRYLRYLCSNNLVCRALFCFIDTALLANLVEVYCVSAGLWSWKESNCLGVPFFGVLGWAFFATPAVLVLSILEADPWETLHRTRSLTDSATSAACYKLYGLYPLLLSIPFLCMVVLHLGLLLLWHLGGKNISDHPISPSMAALGIVLLQLLYHWATKQLGHSNPRIQDEIPRLLACGIIALLWLVKGSLDVSICLVTAASLLRLLAFEF